MKEIKKSRVLPVIAFAVAAGALYAFAVPDQKSLIAVSGVCQTKVIRDKFSADLAAVALDKNAGESLRRAQIAADGAVHAIKAADAGIEIQTTNISSWEKTKWENNTQKNLGTESTVSMEITTSDRTMIAKVLSALPQGVQVQNMRNFSSEQVTLAATKACLESAIADARDKAGAIAAGDGRKVGRLVSAELGTGRGGVMPRAMAMDMAMAKEVSSGEYIQSSDGNLSVTVHAVFSVR